MIERACTIIEHRKCKNLGWALSSKRPLPVRIDVNECLLSREYREQNPGSPDVHLTIEFVNKNGAYLAFKTPFMCRSSLACLLNRKRNWKGLPVNWCGKGMINCGEIPEDGK